MSNSPYPYKTLASYTMGATIWSDTTVLRPDFGTEVSVLPVQEALERTFAVLYYIGSGGVSDVYINGTNPKVAGYTPAVPIKILGAQGLYLESLSGPIADASATTKTGDAATTRWRQKTIPVGGGGPTYTIDVTSDRWLALGTLPATALTLILRSSTSPMPLGGEPMKIGRLATGSGNISVEREDGSVIAVLPGSTRSAIEVTYWPANGGWLLDGGFEYTLGAAP